LIGYILNNIAMCAGSGETFISFDEAVSILRQELNYPEERALHFVKHFDHNKDGRLSAAEFGQFKSKIAEAYVTLPFAFINYCRLLQVYYHCYYTVYKKPDLCD